MATLILSSVGRAFGGPIGGAVGAIAGQQIDQAIFAPKARQGPRLGDLSIQTSSYGTAIPKIFGTMRVAGTVIWSTDLIESRSRTGGGKGRPKTVNYSYSASFAVALSARPLRAVRRIWADGKLLRGTAGDFKTRTGFRLHHGTEDQAADPLIAAAEGADSAPAYRGIAYAVFEHLQLEDFGNRIPSLTFEVEADPGPVEVGTVAAELSGEEIAAGVTPSLAGFAASGDSIRSVLETLSQTIPLSLRDEGEKLSVGLPGGTAGLLARGNMVGRSELTRRAIGSVAAEVTLAYYDPGRDYQTGLQRAGRSRSGDKSEQRAIAAALSPEAARGLAEFGLATLQAGRDRARVELPWRCADLRPGHRVRIEGEAGVWKIGRATFGSSIVLDLLRLPAALLPAGSEASPGRQTAEADLRHGPSIVRLHELPYVSEERGDRIDVVAAAAGAEAGWRSAHLAARTDGEDRAVDEPAGPAVIGKAVTLLQPNGSALFDRRCSVEVELLNDDMWLESCTDEALVAGSNLAILGREILQFGRAETLGERRFLLSRLLRGRRGSEWAAALHISGDPFTLIDAARLVAIPLPASAVGAPLTVLASGIGDSEPAEASILVEGEALRPPSPVHLRARRLLNGDLALRWVRRSRFGWAWLSGSDTPLGEERENYAVRITGANRTREIQTAVPNFTYTAAEQSADGNVGPVQASVRQIGRLGTSRPAELTIL